MAAADGTISKRRKWLPWLHRIGYFTTALVAAELLLVIWALSATWLRERQFQARNMEESRTHEGPLQATDDNIVRGSAAYLFGQLPPLQALHGDGLRFVAMPSFNQAHFAVAIFLPKPDAVEAEGILARFDWQNGYAPLGQRQFHMPAAVYRSLVTKMDSLTAGWPGDRSYLLDGTPAAFEIVRGRHVTSGIGNSPDHYAQVSLLMWNYLDRFAPGDDLPKRGDWEPRDKR